jgi:hypothetical protein
MPLTDAETDAHARRIRRKGYELFAKALDTDVGHFVMLDKPMMTDAMGALLFAAAIVAQLGGMTPEYLAELAEAAHPLASKAAHAMRQAGRLNTEEEGHA